MLQIYTLHATVLSLVTVCSTVYDHYRQQLLKINKRALHGPLLIFVFSIAEDMQFCVPHVATKTALWKRSYSSHNVGHRGKHGIHFSLQ